MTQIMVTELAAEFRSPDFQANILCITGASLPLLKEFAHPVTPAQGDWIHGSRLLALG